MSGDWYTINNEANSPPEILIYDRIGAGFFSEGVTAAKFVKDLNDIDAEEITVRLNSPGGNVFEAVAILNALRAHKARVTVYVDGIAASAASFIAMAGDEVVMRRNAELMIHDAWGFCEGNSSDMTAAAADLDRVSNNIASIYAERTGASIEDWREIMRAEAWYSADEAVAASLADRVEASPRPAEKSPKAAFDLSIFNYAGRVAAPPPKTLVAITASNSAAESPAVPQERGGSDVAFTDEQTSELREALSLPEDATDQEVFDAVLEKLTEPPAPAPAPAPQAALPDGIVAVEASVLDALRLDAQRGAQARAQQETEARLSLVSAAIGDGRIPPARKDHWLAALAADPEGTAATLASLAPGLVPVDEIGHGHTESTPSEDLSWFGATTTKES